MKQFGVKYYCDHFRTSGCPVSMTINRDFAMDPERDVFTISIAKGHHLFACNHIKAYNTEGIFKWPALHPIIDMYLRKIVEASPSSRNAYVMADIISELKAHLRTVTALHCQYTHATDDFVWGLNDKKKICCHAINYDHVSTLAGHETAQSMPPLEQVGQRCGYSPVPYERTEPRWVNVYHMFMEDGHSINGSHCFYDKIDGQIRDKLAKWNAHFRGDCRISDSTVDNSSVGSMYESFKHQNLYARWLKMVNEGINLDPFEWNIIGLLYRKRSLSEIRQGGKKKCGIWRLVKMGRG